MDRLWGAVDRFCHEPLSARPLAFFRVVWGAFLLYYYLRIYWLLNLYYGTDGLHYVPGLSGQPPFGQWSLFYWVGQSNLLLHGLYALALLASLGTMLGRYTRTCSVVVFFCTVSFVTPAHWGTNSADQLVKIISFLFMVASLAGYTTGYYSLDNQTRQEDEDEALIPAWPYRLFQVQLCMVYFMSGLAKSGKADWQSGQAVGIVFAQTDSWMRFDVGLGGYPAFLALSTAGVLLWELVFFPVLVWIRGLRLWMLASGVLFHISILILCKVFIFSEVMILLYFAFLTENEVKSVICWLSSFYQRVTSKTRKLPA
jgi:uncharacterized membrane protein YphA (DoxX/SURF4 family)